ncbi:hypothetical protein AURDEDRAFT_175257 [Auricularia subglabra TFB-10046 SS5]|nr:hypothetical protein AURDEDRAFT_175257 [Auricularia subglabra TFB-10046 SS5]
MYRNDRHCRPPPTAPRGAAHWAREKDRGTDAPTKRSRPAEIHDTDPARAEPAKRMRLDMQQTSEHNTPLYTTPGTGPSIVDKLSGTIRELQALHVQAKLDHTLALDQIQQLKQVLANVTQQLVEAKIDQFNSSMTREEIESMLSDGMPSWISADLFSAQRTDAADQDSSPASTAAIAPPPGVEVQSQPQPYFLEGSATDDHIAEYDARPQDGAMGGPLLGEQDVRGQLSGVNYRHSINAFLWQATERYHLPAPVGRFGHPFCRGWLWEDFNVKRLFDRSRSDYIATTSPTFARLAHEAVQVPFSSRSAAQRQVVSTALKGSILPVDGAHPEPNVLQFCKENPALLPYAIRRHYTCDHDKGVVFTEWDAVDLEIYIILKMAAPPKASDPAL